jgi:CheY-like chemotaxis protein
MFVEDEVQQRETLTMVFELEGYSITAVGSAEEGLKKLYDIKPEMIITDVKLADMDGFTFFDEVRKRDDLKNIPFVFITGYNDPKAIDAVKNLGAVAYVTKPYDIEDLLAVVKTYLPKTLIV